MNKRLSSVKRLATVLALLMVALLFSGAASGDVDLSRKGSLHLTIKAENGIPDARVEVYLVGEPRVENANLVFSLSDEFSHTGVSLANPSDSSVAQELSRHLSDKTPCCSAVTDSNGEAVFPDLRTGLYLVAQNGFSQESEYSEIKPFLVSIPMTQGSAWIYDINASPKAGTLPTTTVTTTIASSQQEKLPQTGLLLWPLIALAVVGAVLFGFGWLFFFAGEERNKVRRSVGATVMAAGAVMIAFGCVVYINDSFAARQSEEYSAELMSALHESQQGKQASLPTVTDLETFTQEGRTPEMPVIMVDGQRLIGSIELPTLDLELPVLSEWSYEGLKKAPCLYSGNVYGDSMVLMAHNYKRHFGGLKDIAAGDPVQFIDADSNVFKYVVVKCETLAPGDVAEMVESEYDLTLFTCTAGGRNRVTVRLNRVDSY